MTAKTITGGARGDACGRCSRCAARPAQADAERIDSFTTTSSTTQAGGHPDLTTSFTLDEPGRPRGRKNVIFNAPEGVFGNPNAITALHLVGLRPRPVPVQLPGRADHGLRQLRRQPELPARHRAALRPRARRPIRRRCFAFIVPTLDIPITIPVAVRTGDDYGLRFTVSGHHPADAAGRRRPHLLGLPGRHRPRRRTLPEGLARQPAGCPGLADTGCIATPTPASDPGPPADRQPDDLHRRAAGHRHSTSRPTRTRTTSRQRRGSYPATTGCEHEIFNPVLYVEPDDRRDRLRLGPRPRAERPAVPRLRRLAVGAQVGDRRPCPQG